MLKRIITNRLFVGLASAAVVGGSVAYLSTPSVALADLGVTFTDAKTFMVGWQMARTEDNTILCSGRCRTSTSADTFVTKCNIVLAPQASTAACLTGLAAACTTSTCQNAPSP